MSATHYTPLHIRQMYRRRLAMIGFGLLVAVVGSMYFLTRPKEPTPQFSASVRAAAATNEATDTIEFVATSATANKPGQDYADIVGKVMKYTSGQLGVEFTYLTDERDEKSNTSPPVVISVSRTLNTICISPRLGAAGGEQCSGDTMEVYTKSPASQPFEQTIQEYMRATGGADCQVLFSKEGDLEQAQVIGNSDNCPQKYKDPKRAHFFQMDTRHPDRIVFLSLGSYTILADADYTPWQKTIRIISPPR